MIRNLLIVVAFVCLFFSCKQENKQDSTIEIYKDPKVSVEKRVKDLLSRMTLEEKTGQLLSGGGSQLFFDTTGNFTSSAFEKKYPNCVGLFGLFDLDKNTSIKDQAEKTNQVLKYFLTKTRLGIPPFIACEGLHGYMNKGATIFPQAIALASTWDTVLIENVFTIAAQEMRLRGCSQTFSPVVDLGREPRWGRTEETYGEDPYLVSRMGVAAVNGFQGRNMAFTKNNVCATLKHFAGHGGPENGTNIAPAPYGEHVMRENYLYPFECAVKEAKVQSVMASYNEWDGMPSHANSRLLTEILRNEWGFNGYVVGDLGGVEELVSVHHVAKDSVDAAMQSLSAGVDIELIKYFGCVPAIASLIKEGKLPKSVLDHAVTRILTVKFRLGLFDNPYADAEKAEQLTNTIENKKVALEAAQKAIVLLKNTNQTLPFDINKIKNLAVIGPNAADIHLGGYTFEPRTGVSVLEGLQKKSEGKFNVQYAKGCGITKDIGCFWACDSNQMEDPAIDAKLIEEAVALAKKSDAVVLVLGENESTCREAWSEKHRGDRESLDLIGRQNELTKALIATGKPVVVLLLNGRPLSINYLAEKAPAILEGFFLGQETGHAVANVLFGDVNPGGKLPITFPRSVGQLPCFYNKKPSRHRSYLFGDNTPLYAFGHGLSYTTFEYSSIKVNTPKFKATQSTTISVNITNTGNVKGDEVVQLYIRDKVSSVTRPVMELKGFARVILEKGAQTTVTFQIKPTHLQFYNNMMKRVIEPGEFEIMIGSSSADIRQRETIEVIE